MKIKYLNPILNNFKLEFPFCWTSKTKTKNSKEMIISSGVDLINGVLTHHMVMNLFKVRNSQLFHLKDEGEGGAVVR